MSEKGTRKEIVTLSRDPEITADGMILLSWILIVQHKQKIDPYGIKSKEHAAILGAKKGDTVEFKRNKQNFIIGVTVRPRA